MQKALLTLALLAALPAAFAIDIQRWQTPSGTKVLLVERTENPIVDISVSFTGSGSAADPQGKSGTADFATAMLTTGTERLDEEAFNQQADDLAVSFASGGGSETATISLRSLSRPQTLRPALAMLREAIAAPRYDEHVFRRLQTQSVAALKQRESLPGYIAAREADRLNYPDHPYSAAARLTEQSLRAVSLADVKSFHRSHYAKNNAVVSLVGKLNRRQADRLVADILRDLPEQAPAAAAIPPVPERPGRHTNRPFASEQAQVVLSMPLITRDDPDYYALVAGNYILGGGGFDSRLMKTLRDQKGYVYGVSSDLAPQRQAGAFTISFSTKQANAADALKATQTVLQQFIDEGPTEAELQQAKDNITGSFPLRFDSNDKLLGYLNVIGVYDLPDNWLDDYPKRINALSTDEIKRAWQRRVKPQNLNVVVVGGALTKK